MPLISILRGKRQACLYEYESSLVYIMTSRPGRVHTETLSKTNIVILQSSTIIHGLEKCVGVGGPSVCVLILLVNE